jgi:predicted transcriptional regulator
LLAALKPSKKGYSLGQLQKKLDEERGPIKYHLRALRAQKKVRVQGNRKFARWMAA